MSALQKLKRRVMQQPTIRAVVDAARLMRRYGTPSPTSVRLRHSGNTLFVDPHETRGRAVLMCFAGGQPCVKNAWHAAVEKLHPTIVVDVGVNYGELLFDAVYPEETFLLGVEANESLRRWIERSAGQHPNAKQIRLAFAFASNATHATQTFYIDPESSGRSSGIARGKNESGSRFGTNRYHRFFFQRPLRCHACQRAATFQNRRGGL